MTIHLNHSPTPMTACDNKRKPYDNETVKRKSVKAPYHRVHFRL